jgi:hypothetical protein
VIIRFLVAISICAAASLALAQDDEQDVSTPRPTIEEAEKLVQAISGDKVRLKAYCDLSKLQDPMEKAEEANDTKAIDALLAEADALEQSLGQDFEKVSSGLNQIEPSSAEGRRFASVFAPLQEQCR